MAGHPESPDLVFVHLSDIHFRQGWSGDIHDEDRMVRNELQIDLRRLLPKFSRLDGLIVSGDIAYGGNPEEYKYAEGWLASICELLGIDSANVMVTPGNHDVNRTAVPENGEVDQLHQHIRGGPSREERDDRLAQVLRHQENGDKLFVPLGAYNDFAKAYGCAISRACPYWERDFLLTDGTTLRFRGITTTLLSSSRDDQATHRMMYGSAQRTILRDANIRYAVIGHHPTSWVIDGEAEIVDQQYSLLTCIQIFGHKHEQWFTPLGQSARIIAGAVHPSRREQNWVPRYSALAISATDDRHVAIRIFPRRWSTEELTFIGDFNLAGHDYRDIVVAVTPAVW